MLTVIDIHSRECLALEADVSLPSRRVTDVLEKVVAQRGAPIALTLDNGTEFTSNHFTKALEYRLYTEGSAAYQMASRAPVRSLLL